MHEKGHCFYGVPFSRPFSGSRSQERGRIHGRAGRIGILLWHRGRAIYLLPDSQGVVHRPRFQTDNWRRENSIWLDVGPYGAFRTQRLAGQTKPGVHLLHRSRTRAAPPKSMSRTSFGGRKSINTDKNNTELNDTDPSIYPAARPASGKRRRFVLPMKRICCCMNQSNGPLTI